jgi:hypothetical protein
MNDLQHLKAHIRDAVATVTPNTLQATWNEVESRLDICRTTKGAWARGGVVAKALCCKPEGRGFMSR